MTEDQLATLTSREQDALRVLMTKRAIYLANGHRFDANRMGLAIWLIWQVWKKDPDINNTRPAPLDVH
jgi:hypothetical protein